LVEDSLFHCQQAAEKAIKGFLTFHDRPFRKTHDLDELAALCLQIDPSLESALEPVREFTVFAWIFRYPGERAAPPAEECGSLLTLAARVVGAVRERVCLD
jgi:HEPN domain-containing protein